MSEYPTLDGLVEGIRQRSDSAFQELYDLTASGLYSYALAMLRERRSAEDAVQQAFLELTRAAATFTGDGRSLRAWLYKSVRFTCLDELRRRSRRPEYPSDHLPDAEDPTSAIVVPALEPALEAALAELTEKERSLIVLKHVVGLSGAEIADAIGVRRGAAYAATRRAERRLQTLMDVELRRPAASQRTTNAEERP